MDPAGKEPRLLLETCGTGGRDRVGVQADDGWRGGGAKGREMQMTTLGYLYQLIASTYPLHRVLVVEYGVLRGDDVA